MRTYPKKEDVPSHHSEDNTDEQEADHQEKVEPGPEGLACHWLRKAGNRVEDQSRYNERSFFDKEPEERAGSQKVHQCEHARGHKADKEEIADQRGHS